MQDRNGQTDVLPLLTRQRAAISHWRVLYMAPAPIVLWCYEEHVNRVHSLQMQQRLDIGGSRLRHRLLINRTVKEVQQAPN